MYSPTLLETQRFAPSPRTAADTSRAEIALVRMEERLRAEPIRPALCQIIARLEAISTIRIDGKSPSLRMLIELEDHEADGLENEFMVASDGQAIDYCTLAPVGNASLEALRYLQTLEWLSATIKTGDTISTDTLLEIHSRCVFGKPASETGVTFRQHDYHVPDNLARLYRPPAPADIPAFMEDLCAFVNKDIYTPNTQAAIAHFQFEGIKPFKRGLDRVGRALAHAILYRRGLVEDFIPAIGLMPAVHTKHHAARLLPYGMGSDVEGSTAARVLDDWVRFCAQAVELAARVMKAYIATLIELEKSWHTRIERTSKGSATEGLMLVLPGKPILTVTSAMRIIDRSFSATNDALARLEQAGILTLKDGMAGRNRVFEATEVFDAIDTMERHLLASTPIARDSFLTSDAS